jgi:hypothetical protein
MFSILILVDNKHLFFIDIQWERSWRSCFLR